jgi:ribonuclease PH
VIDLKALGEKQIKVDCDVLQADGGTRTASITGAYVALQQALQRMVNKKQISHIPLIDQVAAVSCGIVNNEALLDLNYVEDSSAEVDANFILTASGKIIEVQACAEKKAFDQNQLMQMLDLAQQGATDLFNLQRNAIK